MQENDPSAIVGYNKARKALGNGLVKVQDTVKIGGRKIFVYEDPRIRSNSRAPAMSSLDNDRFLRAMLQLRNTHEPDCDVSPAQIVFGRPIRDAFSFVNRLEKLSNQNIRPMWRNRWSAKEDALKTRMARTVESLTVPLRALSSALPALSW